jgi:FkbM family methyltransferase
MRIVDVLKFFAVLNAQNKMRLALYIIVTLFYRLTKIRALAKLNVQVFGISYEVTPGHGELDIIYHTNVLKEYMQLPEFIPTEGALCIDVGANIGSTALAWVRISRVRKIFAFEPHPDTYRRLLRNTELNGATGIIIPRQIAVGDKDGQVRVFISKEGSMAMRPGIYKWQGSEISCPLITLDTFIKMEHIVSIDILKIDIEGSEVEALLGSSETLEITKRIVLEYHSVELRDQCKRLLSDHGFQLIERAPLLFGIRK